MLLLHNYALSSNRKVRKPSKARNQVWGLIVLASPTINLYTFFSGQGVFSMLKGMRGKFATILFGIIAELYFLSLYYESLVEMRRGTVFSGVDFRGQPIGVVIKFCLTAVAVIGFPVLICRMIRPKEKQHHRDKIIDRPFIKPKSGNGPK
jgi:hypothetical protein